MRKKVSLLRRGEDFPGDTGQVSSPLRFRPDVGYRDVGNGVDIDVLADKMSVLLVPT